MHSISITIAHHYFVLISTIKLSTQGEYYMDKSTGNLYVWMPSSSSGHSDVIYASMRDHCIWSVSCFYALVKRIAYWEIFHDFLSSADFFQN